MTDTKHNDALRLVEQYDYGDPVAHSNTWKTAVCNELRRLHAENATLKAGYDAARMEIDHLRGVTKMVEPAGEYPPLPEHAALIMRGKPLHRNWIRHVDTPVFTADQMRTYADATCAMRAQAAPVREEEREAFKAAHRHLELDEVPDAWGRPTFKHSHIEASWLGWIARAARKQGANHD